MVVHMLSNWVDVSLKLS